MHTTPCDTCTPLHRNVEGRRCWVSRAREKARSPPTPLRYDEQRAPTQFISTTFRPELVHAGNRFYGVTHRNKVSTVKSIEKEEALRIIAEDSNRLRQHAGSSSRASGRASQ